MRRQNLTVNDLEGGESALRSRADNKSSNSEEGSSES